MRKIGVKRKRAVFYIGSSKLGIAGENDIDMTVLGESEFDNYLKFWFLLPRPQGADEARRLVLGRISLEKSSYFVQETQQIKFVYGIITK